MFKPTAAAIAFMPPTAWSDHDSTKLHSTRERRSTPLFFLALLLLRGSTQSTVNSAPSREPIAADISFKHRRLKSSSSCTLDRSMASQSWTVVSQSWLVATLSDKPTQPTVSRCDDNTQCSSKTILNVAATTKSSDQRASGDRDHSVTM